MPELICPDQLIAAETIQSRVAELGREISHDYRDRSLVVVGILTGAFMFTADLVRCIQGVPVDVRFMITAAYGDATENLGDVRIVRDLDTSIRGKHVMIIEDIVDTGKTLAVLRSHLDSRGPASLTACALLDKPDRREVHLSVEYCGFTIPNRFVVGYGLDYSGQYRNLDYIGVLPE